MDRRGAAVDTTGEEPSVVAACSDRNVVRALVAAYRGCKAVAVGVRWDHTVVAAGVAFAEVRWDHTVFTAEVAFAEVR